MGQRRAWAPQRLLAEIGGESAFSAGVVGVLVAFTLAVTLWVDIGVFGGAPLAWTLAGGASTGAAVAVLIIARVLLGSRGIRRPGTALVLVAYTISAMTRATVTDFLIVSLGEPTHISGGSRVALSTIVTVVTLSLASISSGRRARHLRAVADLVAERERLLAFEATMLERTRQAQRELERHVHEALDPLLVSLRGQLTSLEVSDATSLTVMARRLSVAVADIVRPLSHGLLIRSESPVTPPARSARPDRPRGSWKTRVDLADSLRPVETAACVLVVTLFARIVVPYSDLLTGLGIIVSSSVLVVLLLVAIRWIAGRRRITLSLGRAIPLLVFIYAGVFAIARRLAASIDRLAWTDSIARDPAWIAWGIVVGLSVSSMVIAGRQRQSSETELADVNTELARMVATQRRDLWAQRHRMSHLVHGSIQSVLISSAISLSRIDITPAEVARVVARIEQSARTIDGALTHDGDVRGVLGDIAELWGESARVEVALDPSAEAALRDDPGLSECVGEIAREAVSNAIRHGRAARIVIRIELLAAQLITVQVSDDGRGLTPGAVPGLGTALLDEVCLNWGRNDTGSGVVVIAELSLRPAIGPDTGGRRTPVPSRFP